MSHNLRHGVAGLAVCALVIAAPATAQAKVTRGPGGQLHGCVSSNGGLKLIAFKRRCPPHTTSLKFGATGAAGAAGAQGPAGDAADASLKAQVVSLQTQVSTLTTEVGSLQSLLVGVSRTGTDNNTLRLSGMNLQLVSGAGGTTATPNGLGNMIIGYNENPGSQTGSANLVLGTHQTFTSYGGIVAGYDDTISAPFTSISGGYGNIANSEYASVSGGSDNTASGSAAAITGGSGGLASGTGASIAGGYLNTADQIYSSVLGGDDNTAGAPESSISGGAFSGVTGQFGAIAGGELLSVTTEYGFGS
jgi:hypothetical protein